MISRETEVIADGIEDSHRRHPRPCGGRVLVDPDEVSDIDVIEPLADAVDIDRDEFGASVRQYLGQFDFHVVCLRRGFGPDQDHRLAAPDGAPQRRRQLAAVGELLAVQKAGEVELAEAVFERRGVPLAILVGVRDEHVVPEQEGGEA